MHVPTSPRSTCRCSRQQSCCNDHAFRPDSHPHTPHTSNISQSQKRRRVLLRFLRRICPRSFQPCPLQTQAVTVTGGSRPAEWAGLPRHGLILSVHVPQGQCCFWKCSFDGRTTSMIGVNSHKIISLVLLPFVPFLPLYDPALLPLCSIRIAWQNISATNVSFQSASTARYVRGVLIAGVCCSTRVREKCPVNCSICVCPVFPV